MVDSIKNACLISLQEAQKAKEVKIALGAVAKDQD
jgi:hypothetical protein